MRGQSYLKMILIDEKGDEILCMLFDGESSERQRLIRGRAYTFENGDINKDDYGCLSMTVKSYNIQEKTGKFIRSYHEGKLMRISDI